MYFYSIEKLKARLAEGPLPEKESVDYVIGVAALTALAELLPGTPSDVWHYVNGAISLLLAFIGTYWVYLQNGGAKGRDFIQRYMILGWVSAIRYAIFATPIFVIVLAAAAHFFTVMGIRVGSLCYPSFTIFEALFYVYFGRQFSALAQMQRRQAGNMTP